MTRFKSFTIHPNSKINLEVLYRLGASNVIDKRHVIWWQLGHEGRKIITEDEFNEGLTRITYKCHQDHNFNTTEKRTFDFWRGNYVPIVIKEVDLLGLKIKSLLTIKPVTDMAIEMAIELQYPLDENTHPHIRGIVIESTRDFLFWYPIMYGNPSYYSGAVTFMIGNDKVGFISPVHPTQFYQNQMRMGWSGGRRAQKRAKTVEFGCYAVSGEVAKIVPYYEFDSSRNVVMVYPAKANGDFALPLIVRGNPKTCMPLIIGAGYLLFGGEKRREQGEAAGYWELSDAQMKKAKSALIESFGRLKRS